MAGEAGEFVHVRMGATAVWWGNPQIGLGITRDGVDVSIQPRYADIQSDDYGGQQGVPSDSQLMGGIASVRVELNKFNRARVEQLTAYSTAGLASGAPDVKGILPEIGAFVRQDSLGGILDLRSPTQVYRFPCAFLRAQQDFNVGTKYQTVMLGWEAWIDAPATRVLMQYVAPITQS